MDRFLYGPDKSSTCIPNTFKVRSVLDVVPCSDMVAVAFAPTHSDELIFYLKDLISCRCAAVVTTLASQREPGRFPPCLCGLWTRRPSRLSSFCQMMGHHSPNRRKHELIGYSPLLTGLLFDLASTVSAQPM